MNEDYAVATHELVLKLYWPAYREKCIALLEKFKADWGIGEGSAAVGKAVYDFLERAKRGNPNWNERRDFINCLNDASMATYLCRHGGPAWHNRRTTAWERKHMEITEMDKYREKAKNRDREAMAEHVRSDVIYWSGTEDAYMRIQGWTLYRFIIPEQRMDEFVKIYHRLISQKRAPQQLPTAESCKKYISELYEAFEPRYWIVMLEDSDEYDRNWVRR